MWSLKITFFRQQMRFNASIVFCCELALRFTYCHCQDFAYYSKSRLWVEWTADHAASKIPVCQRSFCLPRYTVHVNSPRWWLTYSCKMLSSLLKITTNVVASCVTRAGNVVANCITKSTTSLELDREHNSVVASCVIKVNN